ncbi:MAG: immunoglobulin domain-containing protein [Verrucomicrobiota bacterium]
MNKLILGLLLGLVVSVSSASAAIVLNEPFTYADGQLTNVSAQKWVQHSGTLGQMDVVGGKVNLTFADTEDCNTALGNFGAATALYASFKVNFSALPSSAGGYFAHFKDSGTANLRGRLFALTTGAAAGSFRLGVSSLAGAPNATLATDLSLNTTYTVVVRINLSDSVTKLWVNPAQESDTSATSTDTGSAVTFTTFALRQSTGIGTMTMDDLVVGTTFAEVTAPLGNPPTITAHPQSQIVQLGGNTAFAVTATGDGVLGYQWKSNNVAIPGANASSLSLNGVTAAQQGTYTVTVSNDFGAVPSNPATLTTVALYETFTYADGQLTNVSNQKWVNHSGTLGQTDVAGGKVNLTFADSEDSNTTLGGQPYSGAALLYASFKVNFSALPSSTGGYFAHFKDGGNGFRARVYATTAGAAAGSFRLGISAGGGTPSATFPLDLNLATTYRVVVKLNVSDSISTLWVNPVAEADTGAVSTDTAAAITVTSFALRQASGIGTFTLDDLIVASTYAEATVTPIETAPIITAQPQSDLVEVGGDAVFTVTATGALGYQWKYNDAPLEGKTASTLTLNSVTLGQAGNYTVTVTNLVGPVTSDIAVLNVSATPLPPGFLQHPTSQAVDEGSSVTFTVTPKGVGPFTYQWKLGNEDLSGQTGQSLTLNGVTAANQGSYKVVVTSAGGPSTSNPATLTVNTIRAIYVIQGPGHISPFNGVSLTTTGIVTAVASNGFYLQDPTGDGNIATSDAIFVFTSSTPTAVVGQLLRVRGTVDEFIPGGASSGNLPTTELVSPVVTVLAADQPLPAAVIIGAAGRTPPTEVIDDDNLTVFDAVNDGIDFYESMEAMLITVNQPVAVGPINSFNEVAIVADNGTNVTGSSIRGGVVVSAGDFNPERIFLDDGLVSNPPLIRTGDKFAANITGVLSYSFGNFKLLNTAALPTVIDGGLTQEVTMLTGNADQLTVGSFNVENLDANDGDPNPANNDRLDKLARIIAMNMKSPDIMGLSEVQDNNGATDNGVVAADQSLQELIDAIVANGGPTYSYRLVNPQDKQDGGEPGGNIRVAFLFNPARVTFVDRGTAGATDATVVNAGPQLSLSPGRIDPSNTAFNSSRKPLAGEFEFNGKKIFAIVNHFNSKGGDQPLFGSTQPPVLSSEVQRMQQANVVSNFVHQILAQDALANVILLGDLNDFAFSNPLKLLGGAGLTNLINEVPLAERYTYIFDGNSQVLDSVLVSSNLFNNTFAQVDIVHVNVDYGADEVASDHEPIVTRFAIPGANRAFIGKAQVVGGNFNLGMAVTPGQTYQIEYTENLGGAWLPLGAPFVATGPTTQLQEAIGANPQRFYRVVLVTL